MSKLIGQTAVCALLLFLVSTTFAEENDRWKGERISLRLQNVEFLMAMEAVAEAAGIEILVEAGDEEIGTVTVELDEVPWDKALDQVLRINNLAAEEEGEGKWVVRRVGNPGLRISLPDK